MASESVFISSFRDGLRRRNAEHEGPPRLGLWRASDAGKCERAQIMKAWGVQPEEPDDTLAFKLQMGSAIEDFVTGVVVETLEEHPDLMVTTGDENVMVEPELSISGHADLMVRNRKTGDIVELVEIKALNYFFWRKFDSEPIENVYFYGQLQVYAHMTRLPSVSLVVIERNTPALYHYEVPFNPVYWEWLVDMYKRMDAYYSARVLPSVREIAGQMSCEYCWYRDICRDGQALAEEVLEHVEEAQ